MNQTKVKIIDITYDEESVTLTVENQWLPQENVRLCLSGNSDDFRVGQTVVITVEPEPENA